MAQYGMTDGLRSFGGGSGDGLAGDAVAGVAGYNRAMAQLEAIRRLRYQQQLDPYMQRAAMATANKSYVTNAYDAQKGANKWSGLLQDMRPPAAPTFQDSMSSFMNMTNSQKPQEPYYVQDQAPQTPSGATFNPTYDPNANPYYVQDQTPQYMAPYGPGPMAANPYGQPPVPQQDILEQFSVNNMMGMPKGFTIPYRGN